ncbi:MAG: helix-turn-helix domain-containing protein [Cyanobacteria bacterium J06628_3]
MIREDNKINTESISINTAHILTAFQRKLLQKSLQEDLPNQYRQRIQIMLLADEGKTQAQICRALGCCAATVRHWTHIARSGMAHQWLDCPIGRPKAVNEQYLERLKELIDQNPKDYGYSFRRWTANWLRKHLAKELGIEISDRHFKRLLKDMGLSTKPKPQQIKDNSDIGTEGEKGSILINDLKSGNCSDSNTFWLFNPSNME